MEAFQLFIVEQKTSNTVNVIWKSSKFRAASDDRVQVDYEVLQIGKSGPNNCVINSKVYRGTGMVDCVNEITLPTSFKPGFTYTVKLTLRDIDHLIVAGHLTNTTAQSTFTKRT